MDSASVVLIVTEVLKQGILGAIIIVLGWYCLKLTRDKDELHKLRSSDAAELQNKRIEDAKATAAQILSLSAQWSQTLQAISVLLDTHKEILREIKEVLREQEKER